MRRQLRAFHPPARVVEMYAAQFDSTRATEHIVRVAQTAELLAGMAPTSVADLSCGDAAVVAQAGVRSIALLGDLTPGWQYQGPIERTVHEIPDVDVFVCSETLEHVEDPDGLLAAIRGKAGRLLLSTPINERGDRNYEHYWAWGLDDINEMLAAAGWKQRQVLVCETMPDPYYVFQIWRCS